MRISDIIRSKGTEVATVRPSASVPDALGALSKWGIGAVVVSDDGETIEGILSERDIVRSMAQRDDTLQLDAHALMTPDVVTCTPDDTVNSLMELMTERRIRHVPVVDERGSRRLAGIVSIGDVVKFRVGELESETQHLTEYITSGR